MDVNREGKGVPAPKPRPRTRQWRICITDDSDCSCGAPADTPAGMHREHCPTNPASRVAKRGR